MLLLCSTTFQNQYALHFQDEICFIISIYTSFTSLFLHTHAYQSLARKSWLCGWSEFVDVVPLAACKNWNMKKIQKNRKATIADMQVPLMIGPRKPKSLAGCLQKCSFSHREARHQSPLQGHHVWMLSPPLRARESDRHLPVASSQPFTVTIYYIFTAQL